MKPTKRWAIVLGVCVVVLAFAADIVISQYTDTEARESQLRFARAIFVGAIAGLLFYLHRRIKNLKRDFLTGLALRFVAEERLDECRKNARNVTVAIVDVNGLRTVNNVYGHEVGDLLIREVAKRLHSQFGVTKRSVVARLGGDEFIVISESLTRRVMCEQLSRCLGREHEFGTWTIASAGVARSVKSKVRDAKWCADQAMYRAKKTQTVALVYSSHLDGRPTIELDSRIRYHRTLH